MTFVIKNMRSPGSNWLERKSSFLRRAAITGVCVLGIIYAATVGGKLCFMGRIC